MLSCGRGMGDGNAVVLTTFFFRKEKKKKRRNGKSMMNKFDLSRAGFDSGPLDFWIASSKGWNKNYSLWTMASTPGIGMIRRIS
jgi:hypothetical protein